MLFYCIFSIIKKKSTHTSTSCVVIQVIVLLAGAAPFSGAPPRILKGGLNAGETDDVTEPDLRGDSTR